MRNFLQFSVRDPPVILYFLLLVLVAFATSPTSFAFAWNEGRSGLLAIVPLAVLEMWRDSLKPFGDPKRASASYLVLIVATVYYIASSLKLLTKPLVSFAVSFGVDPIIAQYSWIATVDYAASGIFVIFLTYLIPRSRPVTPSIYAWGIASFLFIDTVLPYNSLGPFQAFVPPMLQLVAFLVNISPFGYAVTYNNILILSSTSTTLSLAVYWPSAGLHGIIISVLAVVAIATKLDTGWGRGAFYLVAGVVGSVLVNLLRITFLALYALGGSGPYAFERFHSVIGELLFLPWIAVYLFLIIRHENARRLRRI